MAKQQKIKVFLTDDLEVRIVSKKFDLTPVGSVGLLLRSYREGLITLIQLEAYLRELLSESSLFITPDLIEYAISEARKIKRK